MAPRRRKGQLKGRVQPPSPPIKQVKIEWTEKEEEDAQEMETWKMALVPTTTPGRPGLCAKITATAAADPDSASDDTQDTDASYVCRRKLVRYKFNREEEEELVEWYESNPQLYDKNHQYYRNKACTYSLLRTKAREIPNCTCTQLCIWFKSQRTSYGKLSRIVNKPGAVRKTFTLRQLWVIDKWHFIHPHIIRFARRQFNTKRKKPPPSTWSDEEFEETSGFSLSARQQHTKRPRATAGSTASSTPTAIEVEVRGASQQALIKALMQQATEVRHAMAQPLTPHERAVDTFLGFLKNALLKIPEDVWFKYTMAAMTMAHNFSQPDLQQMQRPKMGLLEPPQQMP
ncbi:uncharacterized protein LOC144612369 isoform X2 [Rhinoraja longicauda]